MSECKNCGGSGRIARASLDAKHAWVACPVCTPQLASDPQLIYRLSNRVNAHDVQGVLWEPACLNTKGGQVITLLQSWGVEDLTPEDIPELVEKAFVCVESLWEKLAARGWLVHTLPHTEAVRAAWTAETEATLVARDIQSMAAPPAGFVGGSRA